MYGVNLGHFGYKNSTRRKIWTINTRDLSLKGRWLKLCHEDEVSPRGVRKELRTEP